MRIDNQSQALPLCLDVRNKEVLRGDTPLKLTRRAFEVLCCLLKHRGHLVTKETLFRTVWHVDGVVVGDAAITTCIREIRKALQETVEGPKYIQTVSRYGYRFIGPVANLEDFPPTRKTKDRRHKGDDTARHSTQKVLEPPPSLAPFIVGRETDLAKLHGLFDRTLAGERQVVFVTGEAGIGKTTVVKTFLRQITATREIGIGYGQCVEQFGPGEPYRPILEAVGRACRDPRGAFLVEWMKQHTPTWLMQMPALVTAEDINALQRKVNGATRERMLREMCEGLDLLTKRLPFILLLEDLHWSDTATLDYLAAVARRQDHARLMIIGTYRPEEGLAEGHPLRSITQELLAHKLCQEIALLPLDEAAVSQYVEKRFPAAVLTACLPQALHQTTGGNPLFLAAVIDDLKDRGAIAPTQDGQWLLHGPVDAVLAGVPTNIRQLLDRYIRNLSVDEQHILQAASIAGLEFSSAAVAAAVGIERAAVEACCEALIRRQHFLRAAGYHDWPDGVRAAKYRFRHAIYQYVWAERVSTSLYQQYHLRIGEQLEVAYGTQAGEVATELTLHFEQGRAYQRAFKYLQQAASRAVQRYAHQEAIVHLTKGLSLLPHISDPKERTQQELNVRISLGAALIAAKGYSATEVEASYERALELCRQTEDSPQLLQALWGLESFYAVRGKFQMARQIGEQCLHIVQRQESPGRLLHAHWTLGQILSHLGELTAAREHLQKALTLYRPREHRSGALQDPGVTSLSYLASVLWMMGYPDQALAKIDEALHLAQELAHPFSKAFTLTFAAQVYCFCGQSDAAYRYAQEAMTLCQEYGFPSWFAFATVFYGYALCLQDRREEGIVQMRRGLEAWKMTGAEASQPLALGLLAEASMEAGQNAEGLQTINEALMLVENNGEQYCAAELYRLKGELILNEERGMQNNGRKTKKEGQNSFPIPPSSFIVHHSAKAAAEAYFLKAIDIARSQQARSWELRATISLGQLWQSQARTKEAKLILSGVYRWFCEGVDTTDVSKARELLDTLSEGRPARFIMSDFSRRKPQINGSAQRTRE